MRAVLYVVLFVAVVLVLLPGWVLRQTGGQLAAPTALSWTLGLPVFLLGVAIALWAAVSDVILGRGTPAVYDPPRRLMSSGPYAWVRNPMYIGAATALLGAAIVYRSRALFLIMVAYATIAHLFVVAYEEPQLERRFGDDYARYRARVRRWLPHRPESASPAPPPAVRGSHP